MSTENNSTQVSALLSRLEGAMGKKQPGGGKKDWAAINAAKKAAFWKPKEGKNTILVLTPSFGEDPFTFWGFHKGLQEVDYWSTPCDHYNKDEFFEFSIEQSSVTNETILRITDFADKYELKDQQLLWNSQVTELKHRIGS